MKTIGYLFLAGLCLLGATIICGCEATIRFSNKIAHVDAPFYDGQHNPISGERYVAQLYAGTEVDNLQPVGFKLPFDTGSRSGCVIQDSDPDGIPFIHPTAAAYVQMRAWDSGSGSTFEDSASAGGWTGISNTVYVQTTGDPCATLPVPAALLEGLAYPGPPLIVRNPISLEWPKGRSVLLAVTASGGVALDYQWFEGLSGDISRPVPGATNHAFSSALINTNVSFWVKISTVAGSTNSTTATVTVLPESAAILSVQRNAGILTLKIDGLNGASYQVQYNNDLSFSNWLDLVSFKMTNSPQMLTDPTQANSRTRYYRATAR